MSNNGKNTYLDLAIQWATVLEEVCESNGEVAPQLEAKMDLLASEIKHKTDAVVYFDHKKKKEIEDCDRMSKFFRDQKKKREKQREDYRKYLLLCLHQMDKQKIENSLCRIGIRKMKTKSIVIENFQDAFDFLNKNLPEAIITVTSDNERTTRLDKKLIGEFEGTIPGVTITESVSEFVDCSFRGRHEY